MLAEDLEAFNASIHRFNAIIARGPLTAVHIAHACRMELKTTLSCVRQLIDATQDDPELCACYRGMLGNLKKMHYGLIMSEACSIELAKRRN